MYKIDLDTPDAEVQAGAFESCLFPGITIPATVEELGERAFAKNTLLTALAFGTPRTANLEIKEAAFSHSALKELTVPTFVTKIDARAFEHNSLGLESASGFLEFAPRSDPGSPLSIGEEAFQNNKLQRVDIPEWVSAIGAGAFKVNELVDVTWPASLTEIPDSVFEGNKLGEWKIDPLDPLRIPYFIPFDFPNTITKIGQSAFYANKLKIVDLSATAREIYRAFGFL